MPHIGPWSNFHELNLDWILREVKQLRDDVDAISGSTTPYTDPPEMDGIASAGDSASYARGNHRHPTDTSRAAQDDLTQEITDRGDADITLQNNINAVDAKIVLSNTAPLMNDSSATAGISTEMSRADHVHPTDTSRASKSEFDTLKATVDGMSGSANPYDVAPSMDGIASAGVIGAYSRGDHVHPADTSKLDVAGGEITGDLQVDGVFIQALRHTQSTISATGWYRAVTFPTLPGAKVDITIVRNSSNTPEETHKITAVNKSGGVYFSGEESVLDSMIIDKVRYSDAGAIDIHYDQNSTNIVSVYIDVFTPQSAHLDDICVDDLHSVDEAPAGETIGEIHTFRAKSGWSAYQHATGNTLVSLPSDWKELYVDARFGSNTAYGFTFYVLHDAMFYNTLRYIQGSYTTATDYHTVAIEVTNTSVQLVTWNWKGTDVLSTSEIYVCYK